MTWKIHILIDFTLVEDEKRQVDLEYRYQQNALLGFLKYPYLKQYHLINSPFKISYLFHIIVTP